MKEKLTDLIFEKIVECVNKKYKGNFDNFKQENKILSDFLTKNNLETVFTHNLEINEDMYKKALEKASSINYVIQNTNMQKAKINNNHKNKISGFVDILIIAFFTGAFIGIILLNIYSKIAQNF